jgi:glycosyltransferase involved in cell wall biosynthesis
LNDAPPSLNLKRVCLVPALHGVGGMVSFQARLAAGLRQRSIDVTTSLADTPYQAVLVIGGTRHLGSLWQARRRGVPLIQRLDGRNWLHRVRPPGSSRRPGWKQFLRAEYGNWLLGWIRGRLADRVVYQSQFSQTWWERAGGPTRPPHSVIYNGVDLQVFSPQGPLALPMEGASPRRILLVEGSLRGGYEVGLEHALQWVTLFQDQYRQPVELLVAGNAPPELRSQVERSASVPLRWLGLLPPEQIPAVDRSAHLLFSADLNAACPNSVLEALACGLPVVAYDTGALGELVSEQAGCVVPYGGDPWQLQAPDATALAAAAARILEQPAAYQKGARQRAEQAFGLDRMVEAYLQVMREALDG